MATATRGDGRSDGWAPPPSAGAPRSRGTRDVAGVLHDFLRRPHAIRHLGDHLRFGVGALAEDCPSAELGPRPRVVPPHLHVRVVGLRTLPIPVFVLFPFLCHDTSFGARSAATPGPYAPCADGGRRIRSPILMRAVVAEWPSFRRAGGTSGRSRSRTRCPSGRRCRATRRSRRASGAWGHRCRGPVRPVCPRLPSNTSR